VLLEPGAVLAIIRVNLGDRLPEGFTVVVNFQVHQLMHDDIGYDGQGRHAQPVGEVEGVFAGAGAPARAGAGDAHLADVEAVLLRIVSDQALGDGAGFLAIPFNEYFSGAILRCTGETEGAVQVQRRALAVGELERVLLAEVPKGFAGGEGFGFEVGVLPCKVRLGFADPAGFACDHSLNLGVRGSVGCTDNQAPVRFDFKAEGFSLGADDLVDGHG